ncbi:uncharacterized protein LOC100852813 [Vitis vinifera]|nr:uncharacterized protein LOC100852813 [Vitis vinifera]|eukprot:XP_003632323.1 PREDICTED: uncharacterized protein LOC100852813 [Vitis vinifera]
MKRAMPWGDEEDNSSSSSSSSLDTDTEAGDGSSSKKPKNNSTAVAQVKSGKQKNGAIDFEALKRHGYKGGLSVLSVPPPKEDEKRDWSWSTGKDRATTKEVEESYDERQKTRYAIADGEQLMNVQSRNEKKNLSFSQKEKRKRDFGQASRGKNYVEEEKRLLRDSGIYSGFDS